jgi:hypothetical protein
MRRQWTPGKVNASGCGSWSLQTSGFDRSSSRPGGR